MSEYIFRLMSDAQNYTLKSRLTKENGFAVVGYVSFSVMQYAGSQLAVGTVETPGMSNSGSDSTAP